MKPLLASAAFAVALTMGLAETPAVARISQKWIEQNVGQEVFGLSNRSVGRLERYIDVRGTPGVIISGGPAFGGRTLIVPAEHLGTRSGGGLLLALSDRGISKLPPYQPGRLPVW